MTARPELRARAGLPKAASSAEICRRVLAGDDTAAVAREFGVSRERVRQLTRAPGLIRSGAMIASGGLCTVCAVKCATTGAVHHLDATGWTDLYRVRDLEAGRLVWLCRPCHLKAHTPPEDKRILSQLTPKSLERK